MGEAPEVTETRSVRASIALTPSEKAALEFIQRLHPGKYEGYTNVLQDYSISAAVQAHEVARAELAA